MMNFFKRKLSAALALLLITCCLLAGCDLGQSAPPSGSDGGKQTQAITTGKTETPTDAATDAATDAITDGDTEAKTEVQTEADTEAEDQTASDGEQTLAGSSSELEAPALTMPVFTTVDAPAYTGEPYAPINGNIPFFTTNQITAESYEFYSPLDDLGRCGLTVASIGIDLMPTEDRESISSVKPSGWQSTTYDTSLVSGGYLYNRAHLIGFQLCGENANELNLITGTRYFNVVGMLPFENMVADYIKETQNHVLYRVTPIYTGDNLVAEGVLMEGWSVEDNGEGICFCVYIYNVQPGIIINYATGESRLSDDSGETQAPVEMDYVLNTKTKKFHHTWCTSVADMSEANKGEFHGYRSTLIEEGYAPCGSCQP